ncbi:hypothetical protein [Nonomuraea typhae]|uniref:Ig-like domain-containing protein n=1 Tax=Nonomuraea typhae TaxID=2603600 RepID=A0ABW7Z8B5_9ACTN
MNSRHPQCPTGSQVGTYSPGLTLTPRPVSFTAHGTLATCVSPSHPQLRGASFTSTGMGTASCVAGSVSNTTVYRWNTGQSSTVKGSLAVNAKPNGTTVLVLIGTVTSGLFQGATVTQTKVLANTELAACATAEGLKTVSGPVSLTVAL